MKVYIVMSGEYSDKRINAVFMSKEKAEIYCATHNKPGNTGYFEERYIEEYDVFDDNLLGSVEYGLAFGIWQLDTYSKDPRRKQCGFITTRNNVDDRYVFVNDLDNDEALNKALKIFCDNKALGKYAKTINDNTYFIRESYKEKFINYEE